MYIIMQVDLVAHVWCDTVYTDDCIGVSTTQSCIPPLTPSSNQKLSQAILAIFHSFDMQQLRIPQGLSAK